MVSTLSAQPENPILTLSLLDFSSGSMIEE
jgi:hypothetical protein